MLDKAAAYSAIEDLVNRFEDQFASYKKADYNETLVRRDFIDPFFKALGWDIDNSNGNAEAYREVIHEDRIKIGSATKAPDYSFRLPGGKRLFFVEAKKPSVVVKTDILPAYQVRRYAWSAKLPISILTDFEELAVYDCNKKPKPDDKASAGRIKYLTYKEYLTDFDFIWDTFSKERVLKGGLDKFIASDTNKKGTTTVDKEFLASLDEWRIELAQNIALRNSDLDEDELNYVVQQTIDRIIFLRIAEDRGVEEYGRLKATLKGDDYFKNVFDYFKESDEKYNSGLFDFKKDRLSGKLLVDNKVLKNIINELYYPVSPYEFSVLSVEILGSAYEQFLGKQIKLSDKHKAIIEEKPEVRKAGGVYYTPQYIVEYIVDNTVGKLVAGKKPEDVAKLKIVDPACGSGSFLIGAYQHLMAWHHRHYQPRFSELTEIAGSANYTNKQRTDAIKERNKLPLTPDGNLTTALKKQILLNNIYGVDLDANAVEVTKLSLLLKCMEGETNSSINAEMRFGERVLPTLDSNIKNGNSLIDVDFYDGEFDFEPDAEKKIKPFSWEKVFADVFINGGFDIVIGNPPYIRIQTLLEFSPEQANYLSSKYKSAEKGNYDIYVVFVERAFSIINKTGLISFILPHKFFTSKYGEGLREILVGKKAINEIIHFGHLQIFDNASTYTCILTLDLDKKSSFNFLRISSLNEFKTEKAILRERIKYNNLNVDSWNFASGKTEELINKLKKLPSTLETVSSRIFQGLKTGTDKIFILQIIKLSGKRFKAYSAELEKEIEIESDLCYPLIKGGDSHKYFYNTPHLAIIFPYITIDGKARLISENELKEKYPLTYNYLKVNKQLLVKRDNGKMNQAQWYGYSRNQALDVIKSSKIFTPDIAPFASYSIDLKGQVFFTGGAAGGYGIIAKNISEFYLLGLLNSRLLDWYLKQISTAMRGGWYSFEAKYIKYLPIVVPSKSQLDISNKIIEYVTTIISLINEKETLSLPNKLEQLEQQIQHNEGKINKLVYELYNLTEEEIKIIEGQ